MKLLTKLLCFPMRFLILQRLNQFCIQIANLASRNMRLEERDPSARPPTKQMYLTSPVFPAEMLGFMVNCNVSCYDRRTDKMGHQVSLNVPSYIRTACCTNTWRSVVIQLAGRMISTSVKDVGPIILSLNLPTCDFLEARTCELSRIPASNKLGPGDFVRSLAFGTKIWECY